MEERNINNQKGDRSGDLPMEDPVTYKGLRQFELTVTTQQFKCQLGTGIEN